MGVAERATLLIGVALVAVLALVPFHTSGGGVPTHGGQTGRTAIQSPAAVVGALAALIVVVTVTWLALATLLPRPPVPPPGLTLLPLTAASLVLVLLKLVVDLDALGPGAWLSVLLATALFGCQAVVLLPLLSASRPPEG